MQPPRQRILIARARITVAPRNSLLRYALTLAVASIIFPWERRTARGAFNLSLQNAKESVFTTGNMEKTAKPDAHTD